jgi:hypothetical protein
MPPCFMKRGDEHILFITTKKIQNQKEIANKEGKKVFAKIEGKKLGNAVERIEGIERSIEIML